MGRRRVPFTELSQDYRDELWTRLGIYMDIKGECTVLYRHPSSNGYGRLSIKGVLQAAHRFAYQYVHGPIGDEVELDHTCHNRACFRVAHLEPVTRAVNARRRRSHGFHFEGSTRSKR